MKNKTSRNLSLISLILGYASSAAFIALIVLNISDKEPRLKANLLLPNDSVIESNETKTVYVDRFIANHSDGLSKDWHYRKNEFSRNDKITAVIGSDDDIVYVDNDDRHLRLGGDNRGGAFGGNGGNGRFRGGRDRVAIDDDVDVGLLDRRLATLDDDELVIIEDNDDGLVARLDRKDIGLDRGGNDRVNVGNFVPDARRRNFNDEELGVVGDFDKDGAGFGKGTMPGVGKGSEIYAYNFPSQGVGAGIGSPAVGAAAGFAGLGAGIGQAVMNGQTVPALGGVGTYSDSQTKGMGGPALSVIPGVSGGLAGLVGGAGAGAAAGLKSGRVSFLNSPKAGYGNGNNLGNRKFDHLPENGSLHIMIHVDGSGSILKTRKRLEVMKDTLLKTALLPYYNNDESLYSRRVTIVDSSGERTLKFFAKAAEKDNVLAFVFQDEAQPDYHLPNFNEKPEDSYKTDLNLLKSDLNAYKGLYRGVMFQVGEKVFSKSFKEFVENAWQGKDYLKDLNLKKYHWKENKSNINNKKGVVFIDEYNAKIDGSPEYYLDLIFKASEKAGINLDSYQGGLRDGKHLQD